jgi:hypothetical protein
LAREEWVWIAVVAMLLVAASTVPYVAGYLAQTPQMRFGGALLDKEDYHSHLAKMWQGYRGQWRYHLLFTHEEHEGVFVQTFYVALGHLARLFGLGLDLTYQITRVVFGFLMLASVYRFIAHFVAPVRTRRVAFLLAITASGLGWLTEAIAPTPAGGVSPMDFWLLDGFTYLALLTSPHFCAAVFLLLGIFLLLLRRPDGPTVWLTLLAVLASLALGIIHPYAMLLADLLPVLFWGIQWLCTRRMVWRGVIALAAMGAAQLPLLAYDVWVFRSQPIFAAWSEQNVTLSPPPHIYLLGYALLLALGAAGVVVWARRREPGLAFPLLWIGLVAVLAYLPWNLQRRFLEGLQVPLGMLAGVGLVEGFLQGGRRLWHRVEIALVVALAAMSNLYLTVGLTAAAAIRQAPVAFTPTDVLEGVDRLGESSSWDETVLSGFETGSLIPARIGHRVVLGHWMETVDYDAKHRAVSEFYATDTADEARRALAEAWGVSYVIYGPQERAMGDIDLADAVWLEPVFRSGEIVVYRVNLGASP